MTNKLTIAIALAAGLAGGLLTRYIAPPPVFAQSQAPVVNEVRARNFVVVDANGNTIGTFTDAAANALKPHVVLRDPQGRQLWAGGATMMVR